MNAIDHVLMSARPIAGFEAFDIRFAICGEVTSTGYALELWERATCEVCRFRATYVIANNLVPVQEPDQFLNELNRLIESAA